MNSTPLRELRLMSDDRLRLTLDTVDEMRFDLTQLEAAVRALRVELAAQRARIRELEHEIDDLKRPTKRGRPE